MHFADFRQTITSPALRAVAAHWDAVRSDGRLPSWEMLRPSVIAPHLSLIWAFKYDRQTVQFTGRLASERISQGFGKSFRGLPLQEAHPPENYSIVQDYMTRIVSQPAAYRSSGPLFRQLSRVTEGERIILPLASNGIHSDGVLGASDYYHPHPNPDHGPSWCSAISRTGAR
jgi:hypothetical protein